MCSNLVGAHTSMDSVDFADDDVYMMSEIEDEDRPGDREDLGLDAPPGSPAIQGLPMPT